MAGICGPNLTVGNTTVELLVACEFLESSANWNLSSVPSRRTATLTELQKSSLDSSGPDEPATRASSSVAGVRLIDDVGGVTGVVAGHDEDRRASKTGESEALGASGGRLPTDSL